MNTDLVIRDARPDERDAVRALTEAAYAEHATVMAPAAWAGLAGAVRSGLASTAPSERIVAERDGVLVGSVMLFPAEVRAYDETSSQPGWPELRLLAVATDARGQGVGRALTEECIRRARHAGASALGLHTSASLRAAIRLYERMGFVRAPAFDFQPPGAELVEAFRLDLTR